MKNASGDVIYVGKAKNLRTRVSSYFNASRKSPKTEILVGHIRDFEFLITENEVEAFILENNLIKKNVPKYNIRLRDDKTYPYVSVDFNEPYPRIVYTRRVTKKKKVEYFGPYPDGSAISTVLRTVVKSFGLRDCSLREFKSRKDPCLLYQLKQCSGPCVELISSEDYQKDLKLALGIFRGSPTPALKHLEMKMQEAADGEHFELAAIRRDNLQILEDFRQKSMRQNAELDSKDKNADVISFFPGEIEVDIAIYMVRGGMILGHKNFHFPVVDCREELEEEVLRCLLQYYDDLPGQLPELLILPITQSRLDIFSQALTNLSSKKIKAVATGKKFEALLRMTKTQAQEHQRIRLTNQESRFAGLGKLRDLLQLVERPVRLECYDVAIWQGKSPTASQIVFIDGLPEKSSYRHYHLKELPEGNNDYLMMKEVLGRRLKKGCLPDIFIVDGGLGQVNAFVQVLVDHKIEVPVVGIAKSKTVSDFSKSKLERSDERLIIPGRMNPYILKKCPPLFRIVISMRDEAHRFSRRLHHKKQHKEAFSGFFDSIKGIGPATKQKILRNLDRDIAELISLTAEEISALLDVSSPMSENIVSKLNEIMAPKGSKKKE